MRRSFSWLSLRPCLSIAGLAKRPYGEAFPLDRGSLAANPPASFEPSEGTAIFRSLIGLLKILVARKKIRGV